MNFNLDDLNEEERYALLFGVMAGDGCLSQYRPKNRKSFAYGISITGDYYTDKPFYYDVLKPLVESLREKLVAIKERPKKGTIELNFVDKILFHKIKYLGFPIGKKGPSLFIPKYFYDKNLIRYIVQGFFATDGSLVLTKNPNKYYPRLESQVIHKKLIKQIHEYLVLLGFKGHRYICKFRPDPKWVNTQGTYKFQFNGKENLLLFNNLIGFVNPKHKKRFLDFLNYDLQYTETIKGIPSNKQKEMREHINLRFKKNGSGRS